MIILDINLSCHAKACLIGFADLSSFSFPEAIFLELRIVWHYALWYGMVAIAATFLGQTACEERVQRWVNGVGSILGSWKLLGIAVDQVTVCFAFWSKN